MARETRPSSRTQRTAQAFTNKGGNILKFRRRNVSTSGVALSIPKRANNVVIKNVDDINHIRISIGALGTHYWDLAPGETSPAFGVHRSTDLNVTAVGAQSTIEVAFWG